MDFETKLGYTFKDKQLLTRALTHSSYANESKNHPECNERMEFLGDAVLSIVVADYIFHKYKLDEGDLTKIRSNIVCEKSLFEFGNQIELGQQILLGKGEERMGGRKRASIVSDAFEAVIAAIYLDGGLEPASDFILRFVKDGLKNSSKLQFVDYKTILQEIIQQNPEEKIVYVLVDEQGPDHDKVFEVDVRLNSNIIGHGKAKTKKSAEQMAAKEALELMGEAVEE